MRRRALRLLAVPAAAASLVALVALALALALELAAPASAAAAPTLVAAAAPPSGSTNGTDTVVTLGFDGPTRDADEVREFLRADPDTQRVLAYRPAATVDVEWDADEQVWDAWVREPDGSRNLAEVTIAEGPLRVLDRSFLPYEDYPPRRARPAVLEIVRDDPEVRRTAEQFGGLDELRPQSRYVDSTRWEVKWYRGDEVVMQVDVDDLTGSIEGVWTGHAIAWEMARGDRTAFGGSFSEWYVWGPMFLLFVLVALDWGRLRSWHTLDVGLCVAFVVSHELFNAGLIEWSVPLAFATLLLLAARMGWLFVRGDRVVASGRRRVPIAVLAVAAVTVIGVRWSIDVYGSSVVDVGYAGTAGAEVLLRGESPYGNMPDDVRNGDTYGPLNYLLYVPAVLALGEDGPTIWAEGVPPAHAVSLASDVLCIAALLVIGVRWLGQRGAVLLLAMWATWPWSGWTLASNVNDLFVVALLLFALAALPRAWLRGGLVGAAAMVKFLPLAALAPLAHCGVRRRVRQALWCWVGGGVVVVAGVAFVAAYDDGLARFWQSTFGFQLERGSPFSPWGLYGWETAQRVAQVVAVLLLVAAVFVPARRDLRQAAAGVGASMAIVQLVLTHWFYLYLPWAVAPFLVLLAARLELRAGPVAAAASPPPRPASPLPTAATPLGRA